MAVTLRLENYGVANVKEATTLNADVAAAATSVVVYNTQNAAANDYALIGNRGAESSEIKRVTAVTDATTLAVAALVLAHDRYEPLTLLRANQIKIYRAANVDGTQPDDGDFSLLTTVDIDSDDLVTTYIDSTGSSSYWYKFTYLNSQTSAETAIGDSEAVRGTTDNYYATVGEVRAESGMSNNRYLSDVYIAERLQDAMDTVNTYLQNSYDVPFEAPIPPMINNITKILAAGYVLRKEYGTTTTGTNKDGQTKIDWAIEQLEKIQSGDIQLVDSSGDPIITGDRISGWPDETTAEETPENAGGGHNFRITDKF